MEQQTTTRAESIYRNRLNQSCRLFIRHEWNELVYKLVHSEDDRLRQIGKDWHLPGHRPN